MQRLQRQSGNRPATDGSNCLRPMLGAVAAICVWSPGMALPVYTELRTEEFTLVSSGGREQAQRIADRIHRFKAALEASFGAPMRSPLPTRIYALDSQDWVHFARPRPDSAGYFVAHPFSVDLLFDADADAPDALEVMFHEYTHHLIRTLGTARYPTFFDEGVAEVFSAARFTRGLVRFESRPEHAALLREREWLPFERLLKIGRLDPEYLDPDLVRGFYAQAWATLYHVLALDVTAGRRLIKYVRALNLGQPPGAAAETLIGESSTNANGRIAELVLRERTPLLEIRVSAPPVRGALRRLDPHEHRLVLGEMALRLGGRSSTALETFNLVQPEKHRLRANIDRGLALLQAGDRNAASARLDAVDPALPGQSCELALAFARGLFQLSVRAGSGEPVAAGADTRRLERAHALFSSLLTDQACWLEATNGHVLTSLALHRNDPALLGLATKAFQAAPRSSELAVSLALLHELDGRREVARDYWQAAARNLHDVQARGRVLRELESDSE